MQQCHTERLSPPTHREAQKKAQRSGPVFSPPTQVPRPHGVSGVVRARRCPIDQGPGAAAATTRKREKTCGARPGQGDIRPQPHSDVCARARARLGRKRCAAQTGPHRHDWCCVRRCGTNSQRRDRPAARCATHTTGRQASRTGHGKKCSSTPASPQQGSVQCFARGKRRWSIQFANGRSPGGHAAVRARENTDAGQSAGDRGSPMAEQEVWRAMSCESGPVCRPQPRPSQFAVE